MARILQDGFETEGRELKTSLSSGELLEKMDIATFIHRVSGGSNNRYNVGICPPRGGYGQKGYNIEQSYTNSGNFSICALKYDLTANCNDTSELYYRVWVKPYSSRMFPITITDFEFENNLGSLGGGSATQNIVNKCNCALITENIDGQTYLLKCYCKGVLVYSFNHLYYNQWVKLDVRLKVGDANNGIFQLRINDKLITTFNGATGTTNPKFLYVGNTAAYNPISFKCDVDDIAVNDTTGNINNGWCGNGSIIGISPTANGSKSMFTPGIEGTQNYENVDDITPDGDASYNSSYALDDVDLFKFVIPENLEIPPTETINAITISTSAKFVEQPTDIGHIVSDGATETIIGQHSLSNDYNPQNSIIQEKSDGTKYKVSDIEAMEFGYKTLESSEAQEE